MSAASIAETPPPAATKSSGSNATVPSAIVEARQRFDNFRICQPQEDHCANLAHGWMLPLLLTLDSLWWGRWGYWLSCYEGAGILPDELIPRLEFLTSPHPATRKMLEASLDCIPQHGSWKTWGSWQYVDFLLSNCQPNPLAAREPTRVCTRSFVWMRCCFGRTIISAACWRIAVTGKLRGFIRLRITSANS